MQFPANKYFKKNSTSEVDIAAQRCRSFHL